MKSSAVTVPIIFGPNYPNLSIQSYVLYALQLGWNTRISFKPYFWCLGLCSFGLSSFGLFSWRIICSQKIPAFLLLLTPDHPGWVWLVKLFLSVTYITASGRCFPNLTGWLPFGTHSYKLCWRVYAFAVLFFENWSSQQLISWQVDELVTLRQVQKCQCWDC